MAGDASRIVIALDGPAGVGKSTVARALAARLGLDYLDTGAMYRAVTFAALRRSIDPADTDVVGELARSVDLEIDERGVRVDEVDASIEIRGPVVTGAVSIVAANPQVREELVRRQREWTRRHGGGVLEGRDIGTVVFPDATLKVYLTAKPEVRAARRSQEVTDLDYDTVAADLARRDALDSTRQHAPLAEAPDSITVDTSDLAIDEIVEHVVGLLDERLGRTSTNAAPDRANGSAAAGPVVDTSPGAGDDVEGDAAASARTAAATARAASALPAAGSVEERVGRGLYEIARLAVAGLCKTLWPVEVIGREHIPSGPFVLAPVHRSYLDTPFVSVLSRRQLHYMGKEEVFKNPAVSRVIRAMGAFPVRRGKGDREALRIATSLLVAGKPVVVFPEGTRRAGPVVREIHEGPAFLAVRSRAPIVPVGIGGSEQVMGRNTRMIRLAAVKLVVGAPIHPPALVGRRAPRRAVRELTDELHVALQDLFDRAQELAGTPNPPRTD